MIFNEKELELTNCCLRFHKATIGKIFLNLFCYMLFRNAGNMTDTAKARSIANNNAPPVILVIFFISAMFM